MMPKLDGFGLLRALRGDERTQTIPVIMLSARAGEESRVEGMGAGADDYLVKPFSARELLARVEAHLNLQRVRREAEQALMEMMEREQKARANAEVANRVKDDFLAMLSHELRTPLNAIIGFSEILTNDLLKISSAHVEYAKLINDSGRHLLSVVNGILDASKIEAGHFQLAQEQFAPAPVIENVVDLLTLQGREAGIDLRLCLAQLPDVVADRRAFSQILINLVSNAIKFTPRGGCVTVSGSVDGPKLVLAVEDTGVGIGQDDLPRLGEAFFQTRSSSSDRCHDGSGLGLSIVKSLVKLHDGEFDICSRLGEGTQVTVKLPLSHSRAVISVEPVKFAAGSSRSNLDLSNGRVKKSA